MSKNVCLKSTLRQPVRTLFLLLLIGLISFAFIARAAEYLVVNREINRLAGYYRAIGVLEPENTADYYVTEGAALVSQSSYVDFDDTQRYCSGVLEGVYNADVDGRSSDYVYNAYSDGSSYGRTPLGVHISDVMLYGELRAKSHNTPFAEGGVEEYQFFFYVDQMAAGYPGYVHEGRIVRLRCFPEDPREFDAVYGSFQAGKSYLIRAYYNPAYNSPLVGTEMWDRAASHLVLKPLNESGQWFQPVEPGTQVDLTDPALAELAKEIRTAEENRHAMLVCGTKDMSAMPVMQDASREYYLEEGRWLDRTDDLDGNRVCMVHRDFAEMRGLAVGDTITLTFRNLKAPIYGFYGYVVRGEDWDAWQDYDTHTETLEIVGLYGRLSNYRQSTIHNTHMFIPDSCMPAGYGILPEGISKDYYSFVLRSPQDTDGFLAESRETLATLGLQVSFLENGWDNFQASARPMRQSAAMNAGVFALVLVLALTLSAFLYLRQRRRDFAILRSLGLPKRDAIRHMLQPIALIGAVGILLGGIPSWRYALGKAAGTLVSLQGPRGVEPSAALSSIWLAGLCAGIFALLLLFTGVGGLATARRPVLELLQDAARAAVRKKPKMNIPEGEASAPAPGGGITLSLGEALAPAESLGLVPSARYVLRHIRRTPLKSILMVSVALCFTLALGWMSWTIELNESELDQLYCTIQVGAEIAQSNSSMAAPSGYGYIRRWTVDAIMGSGFVQSAYVEATAREFRVLSLDEGDVRESGNVTLRALNRPERFFSTRGGKNLIVDYADGWDEILFVDNWRKDQASPVLLPTAMMIQLQLQLGDMILISSVKTGASGRFVVAGQYTGMLSDGAAEPILLPVSVLNQLEGVHLLYTTAEFSLDPEKNRDLPEFRARTAAIVKMDTGIVNLDFLLWDKELTQVVEPLEKNLLLMSVLYPVTVAVSLLIAAGLTTLLIFQAAKEAAIMRVLGTTKARTRAMLCGEQLLLCLLGILLGLASLVVLRQDASAVLAGPAIICAGLYLAGAFSGALSSAISVTNRMPLELLQVKE